MIEPLRLYQGERKAQKRKKERKKEKQRKKRKEKKRKKRNRRNILTATTYVFFKRVFRLAFIESVWPA